MNEPTIFNFHIKKKSSKTRLQAIEKFFDIKEEEFLTKSDKKLWIIKENLSKTIEHCVYEIDDAVKTQKI